MGWGWGVTTSGMLSSCLELLPLHTVVQRPSFLPLELLPLHTVVRCPSFLPLELVPLHTVVRCPSFLPLELLPLRTVVRCVIPSFLPLELLPLYTVVRCVTPSFLWSCCRFTRLYGVLLLPSSGAVAASHGCTVCYSFLPLELLPLHTVVRCVTPPFLWSCCRFTRLYGALLLPSSGAVAASHGCTVCYSFLPLELLPLHAVVRCVTPSFLWRSVHRCLLFSAAKPLGWT